MGVRLRFSKQTLLLLDTLLGHPMQWHHGYGLSQATALASGTLYPILMRLEKVGWLERKWEDAPPPGRPPRHFYRLTANGREWAREELQAAQETKFWKPAHGKA